MFCSDLKRAKKKSGGDHGRKCPEKQIRINNDCHCIDLDIEKVHRITSIISLKHQYLKSYGEQTVTGINNLAMRLWAKCNKWVEFHETGLADEQQHSRTEVCITSNRSGFQFLAFPSTQPCHFLLWNLSLLICKARERRQLDGYHPCPEIPTCPPSGQWSWHVYSGTDFQMPLIPTLDEDNGV